MSYLRTACSSFTDIVHRCSNADDKTKSDRAIWYVRRWAAVYLKEAHARLAPQLKGYELSIEDIYTLQQMCAYEVRFMIAS